MSTFWKVLRLSLSVLWLTELSAHPTGNIIVLGDLVLWPYVSPIGDTNHHACVMFWDGQSKPKLFIRSEFPASDFTLFAKGEDIYLIESRYQSSRDIFETRILKTSIALSSPKVIWPWFEDKWKIGNNGIVMKSDHHLLFVHFPHVYEMEKGKEANIYFPFPDRIKRIRQVEHNQLLLLSDHHCWRTNHQGEVLQFWHHLIDTKITEAPLGMNTIFDVDYSNGELLLAYWGKGTYELIDSQGKRSEILGSDFPWVPHWVAFYKKQLLLFSSWLNFNHPSDTIRPQFILLDQEALVTIWYN